MPTYNNPALAKAFAGLGAAFGPPKASDIYAYARAQQLRDAIARQREGFAALQGQLDPTAFNLLRAGGASAFKGYGGYNLANAAAQPGATPQRLGALYVGAGHAPTQTMQADAERIRGAMQRQQSVNATSAANNAANNARAIAVAGMRPMGPNQVMVRPDGSRTYGTSVLNPGQLQRLDPASPDSAALAGVPKPLTVDNVRAGALSKLPTDTINRNTMAGSGVETVMGPDGKPQITTRADAIGAEPAPKSSANPKVMMAVSQDGKVIGPAIVVGGRLVNPQNNQPYPPDVRVTETRSDMSQITTATKSKFDAARTVARDTLSTIQQYEDLIRNNAGAVGLAARIKGTMQNLLATGDAMSKAFGGIASPVVESVNRNITAGAQLKPYFDTSIPAAQFLQHILAYKLAQNENPQGEVSRQAFERALQTIGSGWLDTDKSILAKMATFRKSIQSKIDAMAASQKGAPMPNAAAPSPTGAAPAAPATQGLSDPFGIRN